MIKMNSISFLLPAYKSQYLTEALLSIQRQTYTEFTCLVSDDCSPEDLKPIFDRTVGDDPRFTYRRNEQNMGGKSLVSHWNLLVDLCKTEYFVLASDDDVYDSRFLEQMMPLTEKYPQVDLLRARCRIIDANGVTLQNDALSEEFESRDVFLYRFWGQRIACIANYMFHIDALRQQGGFVDFPLAWGSDEATVLNLCRNGVAAPKDILFSFRNSGSNISTATDARTIRLKHQAYLQLYDFLQSYFEQWKPEDNPLAMRHFSEAKKSFMSLMYDLTVNQWAYSPTEIYSYYRKIRHIGYLNGKLDKLFFFWSYIVNRIGK